MATGTSRASYRFSLGQDRPQKIPAEVDPIQLDVVDFRGVAYKGDFGGKVDGAHLAASMAPASNCQPRKLRGGAGLAKQQGDPGQD